MVESIISGVQTLFDLKVLWIFLLKLYEDGTTTLGLGVLEFIGSNINLINKFKNTAISVWQL